MFESVDGRTHGRTQARVPSYKLTLWAFGSGELKKKTAHPSHKLQAQQAPALPYAKVVGCSSTGSYPAPSPDPTTHLYKMNWLSLSETL